MAANAESGELSQHRWKHRVLVVVATAAQDRDLLAQRQIFQQAAKGMADRDLVLMEAAGSDSRASDIRRQLSVGDRAFKVFLVGKDGNTAASSDRPFTAADLFGRIDAMPMRRDEMRRR